MNQIAASDTKQVRPPSLLAVMAERYHMDPQTFANTVRKTAMPSNATNEEFAALMMVAKEYNLNPILKEIHAFPKKGGGIQPVVSIDGWVSLINQHPQLDGYRFEWKTDAKGDPVSCKCIMYRKDRKHPVEVEEFLSECFRATDPWKMKHRMLRHKALIQAARYAFGLSGVMDEDEAGRIAAMKDITPAMRPQMSDFATAEPAGLVSGAETVDENTGEVTGQPAEPPAEPADGPSAADAWQLGHEARGAGKALRAVPPEFRTPDMDVFASAWTDGWHARDEEMAAEKKF
ncbi:MAG: RecT family recombinase [Aestuariivirga sp.]|uniref:RecT family recombinase n=1 Tax=Aestuariivirga sp. TaxID=2650926 RepID=UPI0038CFFE89